MNLRSLLTTLTRLGSIGRPLRLLSVALLLVMAQGCGDSPTDTPNGTGWTGTLYFENVASGAYKYQMSTELEASITEGRFPGVFPSGELVVINADVKSLSIVSADGAMRTKIYDVPNTSGYALFEPKVSPDGSKIAFTFREPATYKMSSVIIDRSGTELARFDDMVSPAWTPDGRVVMSGSWLYPYSITSNIETPVGTGIYISNAAMTQTTTIGASLDEPMHPSVSPDGSRVAFTLNDHIWTMNIDGTGLKQITTGTKAESYPSWSPDGKYIAASCFGTYEISYYSSITIVPSSPAAATDVANAANIWPRDKNALSEATTGRLNGTGYVTWK